MARIVYPDNFADEQTLFSKIYAHHTELKTKSPLIAFLKQQKIDLTALQNVVQPAADQETLHLSQKRESENSTEKRDAGMQLPWEHQLAEVQFLKGFYKGSERELGEWGIKIDGRNRVAYPPSFAARAQLIKDFLAKHNSFNPGESPLQVYLDEHPDIVVADDLKAVDDAVINNTDKDNLDKASQSATQQRNVLWDPVMTAVHVIGAFLMGLYGEDSRKMNAWGFSVVAVAKKEREQITTIDPATSKKLSSIAIPSILENIGNVNLQVVQGKGNDSKTFPFAPGEKLGMVKGFSSIVIINSSTLETGKVKVAVRK